MTMEQTASYWDMVLLSMMAATGLTVPCKLASDRLQLLDAGTMMAAANVSY